MVPNNGNYAYSRIHLHERWLHPTILFYRVAPEHPPAIAACVRNKPSSGRNPRALILARNEASKAGTGALFLVPYE